MRWTCVPDWRDRLGLKLRHGGPLSTPSPRYKIASLLRGEERHPHSPFERSTSWTLRICDSVLRMLDEFPVEALRLRRSKMWNECRAGFQYVHPRAWVCEGRMARKFVDVEDRQVAILCHCMISSSNRISTYQIKGIP
jgi:hypothetical protein